MRKILSIAGSDSSGGAGIQADIKTAFSLGCYPTTAITALTSQNTCKVEKILDIPVEHVSSQITSILSDIDISAIKLGMIPNSEIASLLPNIIPNHIPIILDPVMVSTSGHLLTSCMDIIKSKIIPRTYIVCPNIPEAEYLSNVKIKTYEDMIVAGQKILQKGCSNVLIKGGHLLSDNIYNALLTRNNVFKIQNKRTSNYSLHGSGCTLSMAIACFTGMQYEIYDAVFIALKYMELSAKNSKPIGEGHVPIFQNANFNIETIFKSTPRNKIFPLLPEQED